MEVLALYGSMLVMFSILFIEEDYKNWNFMSVFLEKSRAFCYFGNSYF